jgi:O-antigen ligase
MTDAIVDGIAANIHTSGRWDRKSACALVAGLTLVVAYLVCIGNEVGFIFFLVLFSLVVLGTAIIRFEASLIFIPLTLTNPYTLAETGSHLHLSELVLLIILAVWIVRLVSARESLYLERRVLVPAAFIIGAALVSFTAARYLSEAINQTVRYVEVLFVLFVVMTNTCRDEKQIKRMLLYLIIGGLGASFVGISQFVTGSMTKGETHRVFGWHGGGYGGLIGATLLSCIGALLYDRDRIIRLWALLTIPFATIALVLSQTRAWIGSVAAVLLFLLLRSQRKSLTRIAFGLFIMCGVVFLLIQTEGFGLVPKEAIDSAVQRAFRFAGSGRTVSSEDLSIYLRMNVWLVGLKLFLGHPLTGIGVGSLRIADYITGRLGPPAEGMGYIDNQYLQFFAEAGVIAGCAWMYLMYRGLRTGMAAAEQSKGSSLQSASFGFLGSYLVWVIGSFFWVITPHHELFALLIIYLAMLVNITRVQKGSRGGT